MEHVGSELVQGLQGVGGCAGRRFKRNSGPKFFQFCLQAMDGAEAILHKKGVKIIGDMDIRGLDSADVWVHPELFKLNQSGNPTVVAGVRPITSAGRASFGATRFTHWDRMRATGFQVDRAGARGALDDRYIRVDHFRGFAPAGKYVCDKTAEHGKWFRFRDVSFSLLSRRIGDLSIIAEDLGVITPM